MLQNKFKISRSLNPIAFICLFSSIFMLCSCSQEEVNNGETDINTSDVESLVNNMSDFIAKSDPTFEEMKKYVSKLSGFESFEEKDSLLTINFKDGSCINYDYYGLLLPPNSDYNVNEDELFATLDAITPSFPEYFSEGDTLDISGNDQNSTRSGYAQSANNYRILTKNKMLLWNPWKSAGDFAINKGREKIISINRYLKKISNKLNVLPELYESDAVAGIKEFNQFDIVFILCHGTDNGEVILPIAKLKEVADLLKGKIKISTNLSRRYRTDPLATFTLSGFAFDELLPKLNRTVVFTMMCCAAKNNSSILKSCKSKNVADFFGADGRCELGALIDNYYPTLVVCKV